MKEYAPGIFINLARKFIDKILEFDPCFEKAYYRFHAEQRSSESCACYIAKSETNIIDAMSEAEFFDDMDRMFLKLLGEMEKSRALLLLIIDKDLGYEMKFEYSDMLKWQISLADGGTGIPEILHLNP